MKTSFHEILDSFPICATGVYTLIQAVRPRATLNVQKFLQGELENCSPCIQELLPLLKARGVSITKLSEDFIEDLVEWRDDEVSDIIPDFPVELTEQLIKKVEKLTGEKGKTIALIEEALDKEKALRDLEDEIFTYLADKYEILGTFPHGYYISNALVQLPNKVKPRALLQICERIIQERRNEQKSSETQRQSQQQQICLAA